MAETMNSLEFRAQRRNQESPNEAAIANAQELRKRVEAAIIIKHRIDDSAMRERLENELLATNEPEVIEGFRLPPTSLQYYNTMALFWGPEKVQSLGP